MDYLLGSAVTLSTLVLVFLIIRRYSLKNKISPTRYSQAYIHDLTQPLYIYDIAASESKKSQLTKHYDSLYLKTLILNGNAYWIKNNTLFVAKMSEDGMIDQDTAVQVDTMSMNKVQLDEVVLIVEELTRGNGYDSWSTGKS